MELPGWRSTLPILALYLVGIGVIRQIDLYAGDPEEERDCPVRADGSYVAEAAVATVGDAPVHVDDRNGTINDASCLDRTPIYGVVRPVLEADIRAALGFAQAEGLRVSVAGRLHSMGGQAFFRDALILDMQSFNRMSLDEESGLLRVQSGPSCSTNRPTTWTSKRSSDSKRHWSRTRVRFSWSLTTTPSPPRAQPKHGNSPGDGSRCTTTSRQHSYSAYNSTTRSSKCSLTFLHLTLGVEVSDVEF